MTKKILALFSILLLLESCTSTDKLIRKGEYDKAFKRSLKKVIRKPNDEEAVKNLVIAYNKAQERDEGKIKNLISTGQPDIWDKVYYIYLDMNDRYEKINPLLPLKINGQNVSIRKNNYFALAEEAKKKAAEYHYVLGKKYMKEGTRDSYREAYYEFNHALMFYNDYKDAKRLRDIAEQKGISLVAIFVTNNSRIKLFAEDVNNLFSFNPCKFNSQWVRFQTYVNDIPKDADYYIEVQIDDISISPERVESVVHKIEKDIQDGTEYVYDANGNILTDSTGHYITRPRIIHATCIVKETHLKKDAHATATVKYEDKSTMLKKSPIGAEQHFEYVYATANGDLRVLDEDTRKLLRDPVQFPPNEVLIHDLFKNLSEALKENIRKNRRIFQ